MSKASLIIPALTAVLLAGRCGRDNEPPNDLLAHLADRGIKICPTRVCAPLSSRGGYDVAQSNAQTTANIVATFKLQRIETEDRQWQRTLAQVGGAPAIKDLCGLAGRPAQFKLKSGAQLHYFYLLTTADGLMYLIAEYAYGWYRARMDAYDNATGLPLG